VELEITTQATDLECGGHIDASIRKPAARSVQKWAVMVGKVLVSGLLLGALVSRVSFTKSIALITNVSGWWIVLILILLLVQFPIAAFRWRAVLQVCDVHASFLRLQNLLWIAQFINQAMPTFLVGDAVRAWYLCRDGNTAGNVIRGVLLDRIAGIAGLILLLVMLSEPILHRLPSAAGWSIVMFASSSAGAMIVALLAVGACVKFGVRIRWSALEGLLTDTWLIVTDYPRACLIAAAAVGSYLLASVATFLLASDLSIGLTLSDSLALVPVALLASLVPISFAGWGLRESAFVFLLGSIGIPPEKALALSICYGGTAFIAALPGGLIWLAVLVARRPQFANEKPHAA